MKRARHAWSMIRNAVERMSLQKRLIVSFLFIMLLPIIALNVYIFQEFNRNYVKDVIKKNENMMEIESLNIANNIETMERAAQLSQSDKKVRQFLERPSDLDTRELIDFNANVVANIVQLQDNNPNLTHIRLYAANPEASEMWPVIFQESRIRDEPWHQPTIDAHGQEYWRFASDDKDIIRRYSSGTPATGPKISLYREVDYPDGVHVGIIEVDMLLTKFAPKIFSPLDDSGSQMVLLDRDGTVYRAQGKSLLSGEALRQFRSAYARRRGDRMAAFEMAIEGTPYEIIGKPIEKIHADMVAVISLAAINRDIAHTRNKLILVNIALIAALSLTTYFSNSLILKKLRLLIESMKKVRQGDFAFDIPVRGSGEVGELAHHFRKMLRTIHELIADAVNKKEATKEAELRTLRNQIDAHFLYNTLENIKMLAEIEGRYAISDSLTSLGSMIRYNLKWNSEYVTLRDEIEHIRHYVALMNLRYDRKLELSVDIPERFYGQEMLKMTLQPIVENAVKHGANGRPFRSGGLGIAIRAERRADGVAIVVEDDGVGMSGEKAAALNRSLSEGDQTASGDGGIGLRNVHRRVQMYYGKEYGIMVESLVGAYTKVTLHIPHYLLSGERMEHAQPVDRG